MKVITDQELRTLPILTKYVQKENERQLQKWGVQTRTPFEYMTYLTEEVGELAQAISEYVYRRESKNAIIDEAIQVATLALKIAEMYDTNAEKDNEE